MKYLRRAQRQVRGFSRPLKLLRELVTLVLIAATLVTSPVLMTAKAVAAVSGQTLATTSRPNGDVSTAGWTTAGSCASGSFYQCVTDDPESNDGDTSDFLSAANTSETMTLDLGDMPSDFVAAQSVEIKATARRSGTQVNDSITMSYQLLDASNNALTNATDASTLTGSYKTTAGTPAITGTNDKTTFDGARLKLIETYNNVSAEGLQARITALAVNITYYTTTHALLTQTGYVWENDDEDQVPGDAVDSNTAQAATNTPITGVHKGERLTARIQLKNTGDAFDPSHHLGLFYDRGDGYWSKVRSSATPVTGAGSCGQNTNFDCGTIEATNGVGNFSSIAIDEQGNPWISYYYGSGGDLRVAHYVGSGGSGCDSTSAWSCNIIQSTNNVGQFTSMAIDGSDTPWIAYYDNTNEDLWIAKYTPGAGSGCASANWTCTRVDGDGATTTDTGQGAYLAIAPDGTPWISYYDATAANKDLKFAHYVSGTAASGNCAANWVCGTVDTGASGDDVGQYSSIAFAPDGTAWITYADTTAKEQMVATYAGSGGTGCTGSAAWNCSILDTSTSSVVGNSLRFAPDGSAWVIYRESVSGYYAAHYVGSGGSGCTSSSWTCLRVDDSSTPLAEVPSLAFAPDGSPWFVAKDNTGGSTALRLDRYVGSSGTGCGASGSTAWSCQDVETAGIGGSSPHLAFDANGDPWISYQDESNLNLKFATLHRGGEITSVSSLAAGTGDTLASSHLSGCIGGGTYNTGRYAETDEISGLTIPAGSGTAQCTEVAFSIDTSQALSGTTYRFVIASNDNWRTDVSPWRAMASVGNYPTLTTEAATTYRYSKDALADAANCTDTNWACMDINTSAGAMGSASNIAVSPAGTPYVAYQDNINQDLALAQYSPGTAASNGCLANWSCSVIDNVTVQGGTSYGFAFAPDGSPWVAYYDNATANKDLRVAHYVGSSGTGCGTSITAWSCWSVDTNNDVGQYASLVVDAEGNPWVSYYDNTNADLRVAHFVGSNGTGCAMATWTCVTVDSSGSVGIRTSIALSPAGVPWVSYRYTSAGDLRVAEFVGHNGSGCAVPQWSCTAVATTDDVGSYNAITFDNTGSPWIAYTDANTNTENVAHYVGSGGSCDSTAWSCTTIDSTATMTVGSQSAATDSQGHVWISYRDATNNLRKVAHYDGSAWSYTTIGTDSGGTPFGGMAFDHDDTPWVTFEVSANGGDPEVAKLRLPPNQLSYSQKLGTLSGGHNALTGDLRYNLDSGYAPRPSTCASTANDMGYCGVATADSNYDSIIGQTNETPMYAFAARTSSNASFPNYYWTGQTNVAASTANVSIQVWNVTSKTWVTLVTNSTAAANTDFTLSGMTSSGSASDYWEADGSNYWVYYRVYQASSASAPTLKSNYFGVNQAPSSPPASLDQQTVGGASIGVGAWNNSTSIKFTGNIGDADNPDSDALCVEAEPVTVSFTNTDTGCGSLVAYSGTPVGASVTLTLADNTAYHWQARTRDNGGLYSSWVSFGGNSDTLTAATDFGTDATAPTTGTVYDGSSAGAESGFNSGSLSSLSCNWSGFGDTGSGIASYDYSFGTTAGATDVLGWTNVSSATTSITAGSLTLKTSQTYYCNVRANDNVANQSSVVTSSGQIVAPTLTFSVGSSSIDFGHLNAADSYTSSQTLSLTTSTNAYDGYVIYQQASSQMTSGSYTIPPYGGTYPSPTPWSGNGLGYTSSDTSIQALGDIFSGGTAYAAESTSSPGDIVADDTGPVTGSAISNESFTLTYKVTVPALQASGTYSNTLQISCLPSY